MSESTTFDVLIEIPKGSRNKYEYDFEKKRIRFDRVLYSAMFYPADYGFIPETLAEDGDPLDAMVFFTEATVPGCLVEVKPIAVFKMADDKGPDEKIICVPVSDPIMNKLNDLKDLNIHTLKEFEHFFQVYKDLEQKFVQVDGWGDLSEAMNYIQGAKDRFNALSEEEKMKYSIAL
ncbi:inorganic pyrophosphatase [Pustulibacterium marinum]|uniref:Inorganic pyrophosphatase n=1 Tax=Pustulibacterium marinum TaxID=1224947 RepID=A0A1I7GPM3_9FLAO|nr:inorganic diphosphatase [Pustulibacterium marinum]SFU50404.1 inorganic pyrophosphatase [Pustulibacterium marinum]